jgi:hypothetical protein
MPATTSTQTPPQSTRPKPIMDGNPHDREANIIARAIAELHEDWCGIIVVYIPAVSSYFIQLHRMITLLHPGHP